MAKAKHIPDALRELDALDNIDQAGAHMFTNQQLILTLSDASRAAKASMALVATYNRLTVARSLMV